MHPPASVMGGEPLKVLAIQPFLRGYTLNPVAGGKDKAALAFARALALLKRLHASFGDVIRVDETLDALLAQSPPEARIA